VPRNDPSLYGGPYPFIRTGDVKAAQGRLTSFSQSYNKAELAQSRLWPKGTLCITIAANIADTAILGIDACFPDSVVGFTANDALCNSLFIEFFIRTIRDDLAAFAPATAQKNINLETLNAVHVPCPPMTEQTEIVERIETAFAHIDQVAAEAANATALLDRLNRASLSKAFRGELVFDKATEEPEEVIEQLPWPCGQIGHSVFDVARGSRRRGRCDGKTGFSENPVSPVGEDHPATRALRP
jgi:type I restriction enzyme S subunit